MRQTQLPFLLSSMAAFAMVGGGLSPLALAAQNSDKLQLVQTGPGNLAKTKIYGARKINDHAVELLNERGQKITIDFYGPNIFRYFQDSVSNAVRKPAAKPEADILVEQPRKAAGEVQLVTSDRYYTLATAAVEVKIDRVAETLAVTDLRSNREVLHTTAAPTFQQEGVGLTLACEDNEFFYGGGVQNGRFSHRGQRIAIENTNNWVDGGVASPTPFYWSTAGYGVMWHTFKPGHYDFGAAKKGEVELYHFDKYIDLFFMVDAQPTALLNDFYQLTGHPVLLPKFGFYEGHLNAYNRDYWTEAKDGKGFMKFEDGKTYNESQKNNGGIRESLNGELNNYQFSARAAIDRHARRQHRQPQELWRLCPLEGRGNRPLDTERPPSQRQHRSPLAARHREGGQGRRRARAQDRRGLGGLGLQFRTEWCGRCGQNHAFLRQQCPPLHHLPRRLGRNAALRRHLERRPDGR